jgi:hypothetical protein
MTSPVVGSVAVGNCPVVAAALSRAPRRTSFLAVTTA